MVLADPNALAFFFSFFMKGVLGKQMEIIETSISIPKITDFLFGSPILMPLNFQGFNSLFCQPSDSNFKLKLLLFFN